MQFKNKISPAYISIGLVFLLWFVMTTIVGVKPMFLPSIGATFSRLFESLFLAEFWKDVFSSWWRVLLAFVISFLVAYPLTIYSVINERFREGLFVVVEFFRYLPVPVFIPLTILWFGIGDMSKIVIVFLGTFAQMIPMFYNSSQLMNNKFDAFASALKWDTSKYVRKIVIPGSLPNIVDDSRICFGWAWTYLIIAELLGAENGIGYAIVRAQRYLATDKIFAFIIVIGLIGIFMDRLFIFFKKRLFKWSI